MPFPFIGRGRIRFPRADQPRVAAATFMQMLNQDLEDARQHHFVTSLSPDETSISFSLATLGSRAFLLPLPIGISDSPTAPWALVRGVGSASTGVVGLEYRAGQVIVTYQLGFSELLKWALFLLAGGSFFGLFALAWERRVEVFLAGFAVLAFFFLCLYYAVGALISIVYFRHYLSQKMALAVQSGLTVVEPD
jgi:hypothetical protein